MYEVSLEDIKDYFISCYKDLQPPLNELEKVWEFIIKVFSRRYKRIRFYVANPQDKKYYGFKSIGMGRDFEQKFDCKGSNPFTVNNPYTIGFDDVPDELKHPIKGEEESYILNYQTLKELCDKGGNCPPYISDIRYGDLIDDALTLHIPHRLSKKSPLAAISLDFGERGKHFSEEEIETLSALIGTFLRDMIAPLVEAELHKAKKNDLTYEPADQVLTQETITPLTYTYKQPVLSELGLVYDNEKEDHVLNKLLDTVKKCAKTDSTFLIRGESGTGKNLVAKAIHSLSNRNQCPYIQVDCAALVENLLESELFGHAKGSFTGAINEKKGKFEVANTGTIFLDEIGNINPSIQQKLLRVLQSHEFERVGETSTRCVDVRVIAATNADLEEAVRKKQFREDLYYRIAVIEIKIPPLRERLSDLLPLIRYFAMKFGTTSKLNKNIFIDPEALELMFAYTWPGNVREVENCMEMAIALLNGNTIAKADLPEAIRNMQSSSQYTTSANNEILVLPDNEAMVVSGYGMAQARLDLLENANISSEKVDQLIQSFREEGLPAFLRAFPNDTKDDPIKKAELKLLLDSITYDRKKWLDIEINAYICQKCGQAVNHKQCSRFSSVDKNEGKCPKPITFYNFEKVYTNYGYARTGQQGAPPKNPKTRKNTSSNILSRNVNGEIETVRDPLHYEEPKQDNHILERCNRLLRELYKDDQIRNIEKEGYDGEVLLHNFEKEWSKYRNSPDKKRLAIVNALDAAKVAYMPENEDKSGT